MQNIISTIHCWGYSILTIQQTMQNEETRVHRHKAFGTNDVQIWANSHHHYGPPSKRNTGIL